MSTSTPDIETPVSPEELIDLGSDPFDIDLEDICGLEDAVAKLRHQFISTVADPDAPVREPSLLIHGLPWTGQGRLAQAVISEFVNRGFQWDRIHARSLEEYLESPQSSHDCPMEALVDHLVNQGPTVLRIDQILDMRMRPDSRFSQFLRALRQRDARVAVVCDLAKPPHFDAENAPRYFEFADMLISLEETSRQRRAMVLLNQVADFVSDSALGLATDAERVVRETDEAIHIEVIDNIARRSVSIAHHRDGSMEVTTADVTTAIEQKYNEYRSAGVSTDEEPVKLDVKPDVPEVTYEEIGGLDETIEHVRELITVPQQYADLYEGTPLTPASGVLLHGPPGTGKTLLAKALATELDRTFFALKGAELKSKWYGESEARIRTLFERAREAAPSVIFFDEFDALAGTRSDISHATTQSLVNTLLAELDGMSSSDEVLIVAATNYLDAIDPAIRRSGRLGEAIEVSPPDTEGRADIFAIYTDGLKTDVDPTWLADQTSSGTTGADIASIVERALRRALRRTEVGDPCLSRDDFEAAIDGVCVDATDPVSGYH